MTGATKVSLKSLHCSANLMVPLGSPFRRKPVVIGISGVTNGGKTTIAKRLLAEFPGSEIIHQDDFFRDISDPHHEYVAELKHNNWDTFSAIDIDALVDTTRRKLTSMQASLSQEDDFTQMVTPPNLFIIEGILVLNIKALSQMMDKKYYFTLGVEECRRRRLTRNYVPADVPGYFDKVVWPLHLKFSAELQTNPDNIEFISGIDPLEKTFEKILSDLNSLLASTKTDAIATKYSNGLSGN